MTWGTFGLVHILSLILAIAINTGLYFILKKAPRAVQTWVLGILSFSGIAAIIFNLVTWNSPLEYLPFHLCSLNAMILPFAVFTKNKVIGNLTLLWSLGALVALVLNHSAANFELASATFCFFYFPHLLEMGIPILLFLLGHVKLDPKCIISTVVITMASYTVIHFINLAINAHCIANEIVDHAGNIIQVNYMYSIVPDNPLLAIFHSIIPHQYWYMYLAVPIAAIYLGGIYGTAHLVSKRKKA